MKNKLLKVAVAFLFAAVMSVSLFAGQALALGDFSQTCLDTRVSGSTLTSSCYKVDGSTINMSSIDLNEWIANIDGNLKWRRGNYIETCRYMKMVSGSDMEGQCKTRDQRWVDTSIDLDDHIANINGTLTYE